MSTQPTTSAVEQRLFGPGKKRILTLDGGGVRGIISIAFLKEMESQLRAHTGNDKLVLSDVFDLVAGTSVGSILAVLVAMGWSAIEIETAFRRIAPEIFNGRETIFDQRRFDARKLTNNARSLLKDAHLDSDKLKTGLLIIAKRVDTDSVWAVSNNPRMPFWNEGPQWKGNRHYKLEMLIRASTAAPFLFTPARVKIFENEAGNKQIGYFIDGGVSPHNNPALQALMMATLPSYKLNWTLSPDDLLLISVGTGMNRSPVDPTRKLKLPRVVSTALRLAPTIREDIQEAAFAARTLQSMVGNSTTFALKVLQSLACPRFSWKINSEIGKLEGELMLRTIRGLGDRLDPRGIVRFQRYDLPLDEGLVDKKYDIEASNAQRHAFHPIDEPKLIDEMFDLAMQVARKQVDAVDFAGFVSAAGDAPGRMPAVSTVQPDGYVPTPIDTSDVILDEEHAALIEKLAVNTHDVWAKKRMEDGWRPGSARDDRLLEHPSLVAYDALPDSEKDYDRVVAREVIKAALALGYRIEKS